MEMILIDQVRQSVTAATSENQKASVQNIGEVDDSNSLPNFEKHAHLFSSTLPLCKEILKGAVPIMIQLFNALFVNNTTLHFVGKTGNTLLFDGVSLGNNILSCFSFYIIFHTNIGLTAAASQAHGAHQYRAVGHYLHRALMIHTIMNLIMYVFFCNSFFVISKLGTSPEIAEIASNYLIYSPGYTIAIILFDTLKAFLYALGGFTPQLICQMVVTVLYWFLAEAFLLDFNMGEKGIALGLTITHFIGALALFCYIHFRRPEGVSPSWFFFERESFKGIWGLFKTMIQIGAMGYIEVLAYKILSFLSVYFAETQMAAFVTFLSLDDLYYVLPVGIAISLTSFIGNAMGSRDKRTIEKIIKATLFMSACFLALLILLFAVFKEEFFAFYTQNPDVKSILFRISYVYYAFFIADFFQNIIAGILKGIGQEQSGTRVFLFSVYFIALPLSILLGFLFKLQAFGMWTGVTIGVYFVLIGYAYIFIKTDFETQFGYVAQRIKESEPLLKNDENKNNGNLLV